MDLVKAGTLIRETRRQAGLTQADLAKRLHMSRATISQLENGVIADLGVRKLARVCDRLALEVVVQRRNKPLTLHEAYAENKLERKTAFEETDATIAKMSMDIDHG